MKKLFNTFLVLSLVVLSVSCNEDEFLEFQNTNGINPAVVAVTPDLQEGTVVATYAAFRSEGMYGRWGYFLEDHVSDEMTLSVAGQAQLQNISDFLLDGSFSAPRQYYQALYKGIARANFVIDGSKEWTTDPEFYEPLVAEAHFMRAVYYFRLATRYGDVPLKLGESTLGFQPKSPQSEIFNQVISDLEFAAEGMRTKAEQSPGRANNETAYAMLGKTYLFTEQYDEAFNALNKVTSYRLVDNYLDNFNVAGEFNDETLFEVEFSKGSTGGIWGNNDGNRNSTPTLRSADYSGWSNSRVNPVMRAAYEDKADGPAGKDPRFNFTWHIPGVSKWANGTRTWGDPQDPPLDNFGGSRSQNTTLRKYSTYIEDEVHTPDNGTNVRLLRYADVLLMKAEAELFRSGGSLSNAIALMNQVRSRPSVDMPLYGSPEMNAAGFPVGSVDEAFRALIHERRIELAGEGKRFLDLIRWGLDVEVLQESTPPIKPNYSASKRFLPIPTIQIDTNPLIND
ncbi:RagB/SusD family nutrient uptake outer membrane protein [Maribacter sp. 2210JD10-5]|uniref:RagB/SusD family nutrient uptake outer membrane protein n=1 Tax=Maribacter sp. 2210JD10-5 TaxID=3386272 RepID=UPI0039BD37E0